MPNEFSTNSGEICSFRVHGHARRAYTLAFHANLVRAGYEHDSTGEFKQLIRPGFEDRFCRITWETIFALAGLSWRRLTRLQEYMMAKTLGLAPAFNLDLW